MQLLKIKTTGHGYVNMAHSLFEVGLWNQRSGYYVKQFFLALRKVAPKKGTNLGAPI